MSPKAALPRLPLCPARADDARLASAGRSLILVVVRGGASPDWPPDRPVEWIVDRRGLRPGRRAVPRLRHDRLVVSLAPPRPREAYCRSIGPSRVIRPSVRPRSVRAGTTHRTLVSDR